MSTYSNLDLNYYETTSEINKKGINFIASPWNYFKVTATRTKIGGELVLNGALKVSGDALKPGGGSWTTLSDIRIKNINGPFSSSLRELLQLEPVLFKYTKAELNPEKQHIGLIAQDAEKIIPAIVSSTEITFQDGEAIKDLKTVDPGPLVYLCINSIKELHFEIESLKEKINKLENEKDS